MTTVTDPTAGSGGVGSGGGFAGVQTFELSTFLRACLAAFSASAGVAHLVLAPVHAGGSTVEAVVFALVGWFQLVFAAVILVRPSRPALIIAIPTNLAFIGVWAYSRTAGLPIGAHPGQAEAVGPIDTTTVVLEAAVVLFAAMAIARPRLLAQLPPAGLVLASIIPMSALVACTLIAVSPDTASHSHGVVTAQPSLSQVSVVEQQRCDKPFNPKSYWQETEIAGIDTISRPDLFATPAPGPSSDGHSHDSPGQTVLTPTTRPDPLQGRGSAKVDKVASKIGSDSELDAAMVVSALPDLTPAEYESFLLLVGKASAGHSAHASSGDDTGGHGGHLGPNQWIAMTDQAECDTLAAEIDRAEQTALSMPTARDAVANGYTQVTPYVPGIAAHYMKFSIVDGKFEIDQPEMVLYDGNSPDSSVVGLSYYLVHNGDSEPTQGFTGTNDHYHRHIGLCTRGALVVGDSTTTEEQCAALGGSKGKNRAGWMSHAWVVPGCESPWGIFSGASPILDGDLAERSGSDGGACKGSGARGRYDLSPGQRVAQPVPTGVVPERATG